MVSWIEVSDAVAGRQFRCPCHTCREPSALDALVFAYLYIAIQCPTPEIREPVAKYANLSMWESQVRRLVADSLHI